MDEQTKQDLTKTAVHFWYVIVIGILFVGLIVCWNSRENQRKEAETYKSRVQMEGTIKEIEAKLVDIKKREAEAEAISKSQEKLKASLAALEKQRKELERKKKGDLKHEIDKMDVPAVVNTFSSMGITSTVVIGNPSPN